jgi:hypothetical protein
MAGKRTPTKRDAEPPRIDNLKLIKGIGPAVEQRLLKDGIYTFAQLAAFLPGDLAEKLSDVSGMTSERIERENWIGQARNLAAKPALSKKLEDIETAAVPQAPTEHLQVITPEEEPHTTPTESASNEVLEEFEASSDSELVGKIQAPAEQTPPTELIHAVTPLKEPQKDTSDEPTLAIAEEPEHVPALITDSKPQASIATQPALVGTLHLRDMQLLTVGYSEPRRLLSNDQPFVAHLTLDLSELTVPSNIPLNYRASIYAKSRGSRSGQIIGEAEGTIKPSNTVTINVEGNPPPQGTYRLAATVIVALPGMKLTPRPGTIAVIDAGPVQVY